MASVLGLVADSLARVGDALSALARKTAGSSAPGRRPAPAYADCVRPAAGHPYPGASRAALRATSDRIALDVYGLNVRVARDILPDVPYEVTVVVPRAEVRLYETRFSRRAEIILSSVTISHSPRPPTSASRASS